MAYSAPTAHRAVSSETLMLQVRFAHPPNCAPSYRFFVLFWSAYFPSPHRTSSSSCSGVPHGLFFRKSTLCFFFQSAHASGSLRSPSEPRTVLPSLCAFLQNARPPGSLRSPSVCAPSSRFFVLFWSAYFPSPHRSPVSSPLAAAAALWLPCVRGAVRRRAGLRGCLRIRGKGKGRPLPQSPHRTGSSSCSGVSLGLFGKPKRSSFSRIRGLHRSALCFFFQNAHAPGSLRSPSELRTVLSFLRTFPVGLFSVSAPNRLFKPLRCSAWLIQLRQRTALSPLKRSCSSRFAASEPRNALPFLCALLQNARPSGLLREPSEPRTVLSSLCAFLQNARPSGSLRSPSVLRTALSFLHHNPPQYSMAPLCKGSCPPQRTEGMLPPRRIHTPSYPFGVRSQRGSCRSPCTPSPAALRMQA